MKFRLPFVVKKHHPYRRDFNNSRRRDYSNSRNRSNHYNDNYNRNRYFQQRNQRYRGRDYDEEYDPDYDSLKGVKEKLYEKSIFQNYTSGINFDEYDKIPVKCHGDDLPKVTSIDSFIDGRIPEGLLSNINRSGYKKPTPIQKYAIPIALSGRDVMSCAETGSGKTAGFIIPMISTLLSEGVKSTYGSRAPQGLILAPTRELAQQIYKECLKFCYKTRLKVSCIFGGVKVYVQDRYISGTNILVATPGRLFDMIERKKVFLNEIKFFILDEGDRMLDMGFIPQIDQIVESGMPEKNKRQTLMFSATFPKKIREAAGRYLKEKYIFIVVGTIGKATANCEQIVEFVEKKDKFETLKKLISSHKDKQMLVFANTKRHVDNLFFKFSNENESVERIHGDRSQKQRDRSVLRIKSKEKSVMFCTDMLARGIDIGNIGYVVNYDLPNNMDDYVHRIGRTGRVGNKGKAISFFSPSDKDAAPTLIKNLKENNQEIPEWLLKYQKHRGGWGGRRGNGNSYYNNKFFRNRNNYRGRKGGVRRNNYKNITNRGGGRRGGNFEEGKFSKKESNIVNDGMKMMENRLPLEFGSTKSSKNSGGGGSKHTVFKKKKKKKSTK